MVNYGNGKIYRIVNVQNETIYIGSTCQDLANRLSTHKHRGNGNKIVLVRDCPCENRQELLREEQAVIDEHQGLVNVFRAYLSPEQKKEIHKEYHKEYYVANIDKFKEQKKGYREANKDKIKEYRHKHYQANKDKIKEQTKKYYQANKDKRKEKVICEFCNRAVQKGSLKRHQEETKKCLKAQNK
jgi:hypothetical protein